MLAAPADQVADQGEFGLSAGVAGVELQGLVVRLACELGVHITEVFVGGGIGRVRADGHLERLARFFVLPLRRVEHREIVVRLGKLGVILGELGEDVDRISRLVLLGEDQALEEPALRVLGLLREILIDTFERLRLLTLLEEFADVLELIGVHSAGRQQERRGGGEKRGKKRRETDHRAILPGMF